MSDVLYRWEWAATGGLREAGEALNPAVLPNHPRLRALLWWVPGLNYPYSLYAARKCGIPLRVVAPWPLTLARVLLTGRAPEEL